MADRKWHIYCLKDPATGNIRYVGVTSGNVVRRVRAHVWGCHRHSFRAARWLKSLRDKGLFPRFETMQSGEGEGWQEAEKRWISHMRDLWCDLTNATDGGEGCPGRVLTEEHKQKLADAARGRERSPESVQKSAAGIKGRIYSPEHRGRISAAHAGVKFTNERRLNISLSLKGKKPSKDAIAKMSAARKGRTNSPETVAKIIATRRANGNYTITDETKRKISEAHKRFHARRRAELRILP